MLQNDMGASVLNEASFNSKAVSIRWVREDVKLAGFLHFARLPEGIGQLRILQLGRAMRVPEDVPAIPSFQ